MHASTDLANDSIGTPTDRLVTRTRRPRFPASRLFYFVTLCASSVALFGWLGLPIGCFVMLIWVQLLVGIQREEELVARAPLPAPTRLGMSKIEVLAVLLIVLLLVGLFTPAVGDSDPMQHAETSMKQVAKAVDAYYQHHGEYPPTIACDSNGTPMHSWRALILPYLHEDKLAASYRWDEAWNGPNNSQLMQYRPWHYRLYYPETQTLRTLSSLHLLRDESQRVFVVEHEQAKHGWLEPTSIAGWQAFDELSAADQGFWHHGFFVSSYRGRLAVSNELSLCIHPSPSAPRSAIAIDVARVNDKQRVDVGTPYLEVHFDNALRLGIFLLIALYPFRWLHAVRPNAQRP